jgi:pantothenate kinase type III
MVVVMVGTAVTVEAVDAEGKFLGGFILPGHGIMLRALESARPACTCRPATCANSRPTPATR